MGSSIIAANISAEQYIGMSGSGYAIDTVNVKNSMNSFQMMDVAQAFIQQYTHSSLKDLMAKYGKLGPIYDRLDVPTVMDFISKYQEAKSRLL